SRQRSESRSGVDDRRPSPKRPRNSQTPTPPLISPRRKPIAVRPHSLLAACLCHRRQPPLSTSPDSRIESRFRAPLHSRPAAPYCREQPAHLPRLRPPARSSSSPSLSSPPAVGQ